MHTNVGLFHIENYHLPNLHVLTFLQASDSRKCQAKSMVRGG